MKKIVYFCIVLCLSFLTASFWNCTDSELVKGSPQVPHKDFSLEEAKEFFEKQYLKNVPVTRALNKGKKKRLVTPGDFVPQWEKATASARAGLACYDIPIENDVHYKALYSIYHNGKAKAYSVNVYQKLVIVKNQSTGNMGTYILNLIPTAEYDKKYLKQVGNRFVNCADKGGFSGIAFYTIPNLDRILRVNYYENGVKKKGVFLLGKREQMEEKMKVACQILHGVVVKGKKKIATRGYGEDDWWEYDDWWDDYDDDDDDFYDDTDKEDFLWDMNSGAFLNPDDFDSGNGTFTETEDGVIYIDQNGNVFEMEDTDGDGWLDTPIASEVVIEPEENLDWDTGNEEWMEATRPGGIDYEDPDDEEDDNNDDDGSNTDFTEEKDKGKNDEQEKEQDSEYEREFAIALSEITPILDKLGIDLKEYKIELNKEHCAANAKALADNTIAVCTQFFNYTRYDQASIIWHEIYHINSGHNSVGAESSIRIELPMPPTDILEGLKIYIEWANKDMTPDIMDLVKAEHLQYLLVEEKTRDIQWYNNEVETYAAEKNNGIPKSDYYEGLMNFYEWKYEQIVSRLDE
ncbi:hypothetical protein [uncultured Bacteroides sp.]|uniref:hypothetical protein n=1 Tax=uncultured Bacteroides sp. TaxID=162156 RepID=UPI0025EFE6A6|nr:hypothetical protein [uncultured Bacteroides sp.]